MATADKLQRVLDTKNELRAALNTYLAEYELPLVPEDAMFRAYPAFVETIALNRPPPLVVVASGEEGAIIDVTEDDNGKVVFTDTGGVTEATYGDPVARVADLKAINGNARPALQSSTALRPVYGRAPVAGRRNLFGDTSFGSGWGEYDITNLVPGVTDRMGGNNAAEFDALPNEIPRLRYETVSVENGLDYRFSMEWKRISGTPGLYEFGLGFTGTSGRGEINVRPDGTIEEEDNGFAVRDGVIDILEDGWKRLTFTFTPDTDADERLGVWFASDDSVDYRVRVGRPQVEVGTVRTAFQQVRENGFDVTEAGASSPAYLRFDLSDDKMTHTFPEGFTGDVMLFGRKGSWIEENVTIPPGGDLDIGPGGVNADASGFESNPDGGIPGVLEAIGDVVGWLPVGRVLSASERQYMVEYYKERGAKGLLVPGPELIVNNNFSDGFTGWGSSYEPVEDYWEIIDGKATLKFDQNSDNVPSDQGDLRQDTSLTVGAFYFYRARTSDRIYRTSLGGALSGEQVRPIRETIDPDGGIVTEGIGTPTDIYGKPDISAVRFHQAPAGTWLDWFSLRELRPEEEW